MEELLKNSQLTQAEFGKKIGVSQQTISKWKTGKSLPSWQHLEHISKICNLSIDHIVKVLFENKKKIADGICDTPAIFKQDKSV